MYRTALVPGISERAVVVVHCSDPRYQPHFQDFLAKGLGLPRYGLVAVPGGCHFLTLAEHLPKFAWAGSRWLKFMVRLTDAGRVILIGHDDCRWYVEQGFARDAAQATERQIDDLAGGAAWLRERFPTVAVECYFARLDGDAAVVDVVGPPGVARRPPSPDYSRRPE